MGKNYYLGLDIGTGSVGWAVTDEQYQIPKVHGKALWGSRLFETASTAEERRINRTSRRRLRRRNQRVEWLQELFAEEINKKDPGFYRRMKESRYWAEDKLDEEGKRPEVPYSLFADKDYTDQEYHKQFPTIFHLRKWLMETQETPDIRLVYLAFLHMIKHRGHFLLSGSIDEIKEFKTTFTQFLEVVKDEELGFDREFDQETYQQSEKILKDRELTRSAKKTRMVKALGAENICEKEWLTLITGGTAKLSNLFDDKELDETERPKLCFSDAGYEDYAGEIEAELNERYCIVESAKAVYDWAILADILGEYKSISEAKVASYEKHKNDLTYLKDLVKDNLPKEEYKKLFSEGKDKTTNYCAYIGKIPGKEFEGKKCSKEEFYSYLKKNIVESIADENKTKYLREEIEKGTFLPKQMIKDNSVIPYQVHLYELDKILANLKDKIPLIEEEGDKIRQIFTFRLPYYVGPLNGVPKSDGERTNWAERKAEKIYPWNFQEIVDEETSAQKFIRRMTNKCTYLLHEDVLPKYSLLYSKFTVLNELNNLRLNGEPLSVDLKQKIYEEVFQKNRKVTLKKLKRCLVLEGFADRNVDITGVDGDFKSALTAYHDFKEKISGVHLSEEQKEEIILNISLFGDARNLLKNRLKKLYPQLTDKQREDLSRLSYRGWGHLSRKFLEGVTIESPLNGEDWTIIKALWETNENLSQLLGSKYTFTEAIEKENGFTENADISYQTIEELGLSPAVKRQVWQSVLIVKEICKVQKGEPKRLFVEMAREKTDSGRTESRKKKLLDLYKSCAKEEKELVQNLEMRQEADLRRDKLFLYYTQKGRCMYTGRPIDLEKMLRDNKTYDIDHIYTQSKVMDDSLDNRVLVEKIYNQEKTDIYPIDEKIRKKMQPFWKSLADGGFISEEKYKRLTRATEFEAAELAGFISRQLVETRQSTKAVANILKQMLPDTEIVYVKARIVSNFRQDFKLPKVREINDLHHAKDAYLNIVVGNTYHVKFTQSPVRFIENSTNRSYNLKKMFVAGKVSRNGETAWVSGNDGTIVTVRKFMRKNNILVTRRAYEVTGGLFDQQPMKKGKGQVPVKGNDERLQNIEKYGGYNKEAGAYFTLVESEDKKGKKIRSIEYVPVRMKKQVEQSKEALEAYLVQQRGLKNPIVLLNKIRIDTLFNVDGFHMWLSARAGKRLIFKGANQLVLSDPDEKTLKKVVKFINRRKENKNVEIYSSDGLTSEMLEEIYDTFLRKIRNTIYGVRLKEQEKTLSSGRENFEKLKIEDQCMVIYEILHLFQCQSTLANLKLIGGPGNAGRLGLNSDITKYENISIINQSVTGIYEQAIDLKKV